MTPLGSIVVDAYLRFNYSVAPERVTINSGMKNGPVTSSSVRNPDLVGGCRQLVVVVDFFEKWTVMIGDDEWNFMNGMNIDSCSNYRNHTPHGKLKLLSPVTVSYSLFFATSKRLTLCGLCVCSYLRSTEGQGRMIL